MTSTTSNVLMIICALAYGGACGVGAERRIVSFELDKSKTLHIIGKTYKVIEVSK